MMWSTNIARSCINSAAVFCSGTPKREFLYVDDLAHGIESAKKTGVTVFGMINNGHNLPERIIKSFNVIILFCIIQYFVFNFSSFRRRWHKRAAV